LRGVPQVIQLAIKLQQTLSSSLGQHGLRHLQQGHVAHGCAQKPHGQTHGQYSVREVRSDVCNKSRAQETPAEIKMRQTNNLVSTATLNCAIFGGRLESSRVYLGSLNLVCVYQIN
jgi:hypothetical protein